MRMLILLTLVVPAAVSAERDLQASAKVCVPGNRLTVSNSAKPVTARPLGSEPPAAQMLAIYRKIDGCPIPIVLRKGLGMNKDRQQPIGGDTLEQPLAD